MITTKVTHNMPRDLRYLSCIQKHRNVHDILPAKERHDRQKGDIFVYIAAFLNEWDPSLRDEDKWPILKCYVYICYKEVQIFRTHFSTLTLN